MKRKAMVLELEKNLNSFSPFFNDWVNNERCTLNEEDLYLIEIHLRNNFKISLYESFMFFNNNKNIDVVNTKLKIELRKYKEWLVSNFLFNIISMMKENDVSNILICNLKIHDKLKQRLYKFDVRTLTEIFSKFNEKDFLREKNFKQIIEFEKVFREINSQNIPPMKKIKVMT